MNVLVVGANGMLGRDIVELYRLNGFDVLGTDRTMLDITDFDAVMKFVQDYSPDIIINAAAFNFVDRVEEDEVFPVAMSINGDAPGYLAQAAKECDAIFVHVSSDYVFSGEKPEGYKEDDATGPISRYGETKQVGEKSVERVGGKVYIVRTSKLFGRPGISSESKESFVQLMLRLANERPELNIVDEEVGNPTYTPDLAGGIYDLIEGGHEFGTYHLVNGGLGVTWYQFAKEIFDTAEVSVRANPVSSKEFPKPARRPKFAPLLSTKFPPLRNRIDALREFLSK